MKKGQVTINVNDIIGKRLGKLKVISYAFNRRIETKGGERVRHWYTCECDCNNVFLVQRGPLLNNNIHSCGCGRRNRSWLR